MSEKTMAKSDLAKSLEFLEEISKAKPKGTQLGQGTQKRPVHPDPHEQYIEDFGEDDWDDDIENDSNVDYEHTEQLASTTAAGKKTDSDPLHDSYSGDYMPAKRGMKPKGKVKKSQKAEEEVDPREAAAQAEATKAYYKAMAKSFDDKVEEDETLRKGIEVSPFLAHLTRAFSETVHELAATMEKSLNDRQEEQDMFNLELAKALHKMNKALENHKERIEEVEGTPNAPKSVEATGVQKSFADQPQGEEGQGVEGLTRTQAMNILIKGVEADELNANEVIKLETTGKLGIEGQQYLAKALA